MKAIFIATALLAGAATFGAQAQDNRGAAGGAVGGAAAGAVGGAIVGGPVGAAVGGVVGGIDGAAAGGIATEDRTYVQGYVVKHPAQAVRIEGDVAVGTELPRTVRYYNFEGNERLRAYRYARVNDRYVVVDASGRVVEVIR